MPVQGFFETFSPDDVAKNVSAMALKKIDLDQAARQIKVAEDKWETEKGILTEQVKRQNAFRQTLTEQIASKKGALQAMNPEHPDIKALDIIQTGLITGGIDVDKAVADLVTLENKSVPSPKFVNYVDPKDPTKSKMVLEGRETPPAGYVTEPTLRAMKPPAPTKASLTQSALSGDEGAKATLDEMERRDAANDWSSNSVTEKDGLPVWKNKQKETVVRKPDGTEETYDPAKHGRELSSNVSQTNIYNQNQASNIKPGTLDYWASIYETTGQIPSFGMGTKGATQREAFLNKVAERAIARGEGEDGVKQAVRVANFKASQFTLTDLTKREQLVQSYNYRIGETSDKVLVPLIKKWDLQNPKFLNMPINKLGEIMGSGDLAALKLALNSVSVEVGKVEFNALGIQQLSESAAKFMNQIHDPAMSVKDLLKVIDTSKQLGDTGAKAIANQRADLMKRMYDITAEGQKKEEVTAPGRIKVDPKDVKILRR